MFSLWNFQKWQQMPVKLLKDWPSDKFYKVYTLLHVTHPYICLDISRQNINAFSHLYPLKASRFALPSNFQWQQWLTWASVWTLCRFSSSFVHRVLFPLYFITSLASHAPLSPFSPPLSSPSHIYAFISHLGLVEQYKQHDEHVQRDRWLWQRKGERRDPAQCQLQLQDRRSQCPCERMSQPGSRRWEEAAHRCVREHARTHTHNGVRGLCYNLLCVLVAGMWRLTCCQISPDRARGRRASRPTPLTLFSTRLCGCVRGKLNES